MIHSGPNFSAREVGIDPDVLDELKRLGVTDLAQLRTRLKADPDEEDEDERGGDGAADDDPGQDEGDENDDGGGTRDDDKPHEDDDGARGGKGGTSAGSGRGSRNGSGKSKGGGGDRGGGEREFISYVAAHAGGSEADLDGLTQQERMRLEDQAITRILEIEPGLKRMPPSNKGYDLIEMDAVGEPQRWIEVKAMKGGLAGRPVGLSQPQMEHARRYGDQYWLYVVEHAADEARARLLKIRNPFGRTGTFTFDRGWIAVAIVQNCANDPPAEA